MILGIGVGRSVSYGAKGAVYSSPVATEYNHELYLKGRSPGHRNGQETGHQTNTNVQCTFACSVGVEVVTIQFHMLM